MQMTDTKTPISAIPFPTISICMDAKANATMLNIPEVKKILIESPEKLSEFEYVNWMQSHIEKKTYASPLVEHVVTLHMDTKNITVANAKFPFVLWYEDKEKVLFRCIGLFQSHFLQPKTTEQTTKNNQKFVWKMYSKTLR